MASGYHAVGPELEEEVGGSPRDPLCEHPGELESLRKPLTAFRIEDRDSKGEERDFRGTFDPGSI